MADGYGRWGAILAASGGIEGILDAAVRAYYDPFEFAIASAVASEHWTGEVFVGAAEASDADINTTTAGKAYVMADPDGTPVATGYWLRKNATRNSPFFTVIVDADFTWGTPDAGNLDGGVWITKGAAYDANNHMYLVRRKSTTGPLDIIAIDGALNGVGLTEATAAITSDAVAFKIERWDDQWRFYYSLTQAPDYNWVLVGYFEDTSNFMTDEVSIALGASSPGVLDAESLNVDFDNFKFYDNMGGIVQMITEGYNSTHIASNEDGSIMERLEWVQVALGGGAIQLRVEQSKSGAVEEDAFMAFAISLFDIDTGAVQVADIDITGIAAVLEKSTGGAAFNAAGITQPTFTKANGLVSDDNRFLAAEWEIGDTYRLQVSGITCTVAGDTAYVKDVVWSNLITELVNVEAKIDAIQADLGDVADAATADDLSDIATTSAHAKLGRLLLRFSANAFSSTIQGAAATDIEGMMSALATYFSPAGAAWSVQSMNQVADVNLETTWEQYLTTLGVDGANVWSDINNVTPGSMDAIFQAMAALWGADGANTFLPTIFGGTRATLELALSNLAIYFSPAGAAWSVQMNNATADASLEETWEEYTRVVGVDGANQLTNINNTANLTFDAVWQKFATQIGIDGANTFAPAMFGATPATQEAAFTALGTAFGAEFDGSPDVYDTLVTGYDSSGTLANRDGSILERLEEMKAELAALGFTGQSFFADYAQADDSGDGLTLATAKKTIDAAVNLTTANAGDVVFAFSSDGSTFDEDANTAGVELDTAKTALVGLGRPVVENSNGAATAVITVTGGRNLVKGFNIDEGSEIWGIYINGVDYNTITDNIIWGDMETGIKLNDSDWNQIFGNHIAEMGGGGDEGITIDGSSRSNRVSRNFIDNTDKGVELTGTGTQNVIWDNIFGGINGGMAVGVNIGAGVGHTIIVGNHFNDVLDNIADAGTSTDISGNFSNYTDFNNSALETDDDWRQALAALFAADGANVFNPTIQGAAQTDLELALTNIAAYFAAGGAAISATIDPGGTTRVDIETLWEDLGMMLAGANGITTWPVGVAPGDGVSFAEAIREIYNVANFTYNQVNAIPTLQETGGTLTGAGGGEQNIVIQDAPAGVFKPLRLKISLGGMLAGDTTVIRQYSRLSSGGAMEIEDYAPYVGADGGLLNGKTVIIINIPENRFGFKITLDETVAGTRDYVWEYFEEA